MADSPNRQALTGFPAVQEPRDAPRSTQTTVINIRERLRLIEAEINSLQSVNVEGEFPEAPADGNIYGRRNRAWTIVNKFTGLKFTYAETAPGINNPGDEWLESDTGILYTWMDDGSSKQWVETGSAGSASGIVGSGVDVQVFSTPGTYTWTKPTGAVSVTAYIVAGGGGGGSGGVDATGAAQRTGGGAGGGGCRMVFVGDADSVSATETVVVGSGGAGGAGVNSGAGNGNSGGTGTLSSFAGNAAYGGGLGQYGGASGSNGGGGGGGSSPGAPGSSGGFGGALPGATFNGGAATDNLNDIGGGGGGCNLTPSSGGTDGGRAFGGGQGGGGGGRSDGGIGGNAYEWGLWAATTVAGGGASTAGESVAGMAISLRGAGGGGGGGSTTANAGAGGDGQQPGGGGGGGGAYSGTGGFYSGAGGNGGDGIVLVRTDVIL
jgi:hypothetical protein